MSEEITALRMPLGSFFLLRVARALKTLKKTFLACSCCGTNERSESSMPLLDYEELPGLEEQEGAALRSPGRTGRPDFEVQVEESFEKRWTVTFEEDSEETSTLCAPDFEVKGGRIIEKGGNLTLEGPKVAEEEPVHLCPVKCECVHVPLLWDLDLKDFDTWEEP